MAKTGQTKTQTDTEVAMSNSEKMGHNSEGVKSAILDYFKERVAIEVERRKLTKRMGRARGKLKDLSLDTQAVDREYAYFKQKKHDRDGYDDSVKLTHEALNAADTGNLFAPLYDVENAV